MAIAPHSPSRPCRPCCDNGAGPINVSPLPAGTTEGRVEGAGGRRLPPSLLPASCSTFLLPRCPAGVRNTQWSPPRHAPVGTPESIFHQRPELASGDSAAPPSGASCLPTVAYSQQPLRETLRSPTKASKISRSLWGNRARFQICPSPRTLPECRGQ